ncbi:protein CutA isoform X3 [Rousettus aegyptiacus]|uniref:CutA divalent cation tolerance-like protein n=1 Tax=Rousettus aegyptiacus TaxID=9407 RepID=A0A7J8K6P7_ROUAE|nr:protein CutA isoform X3 [Rousettus aegyptiacus]XP_016002473.1 protein CutA isoform X3 [Rousettus aegyptiacus]KAF6504534.1 cutA divalent cation tolerance-like protein [Rousettus aegyptiacus]
MREVRATAVLLGGGVSDRPCPFRSSELVHHPLPKSHRAVVEKRLAACVNVIPQITSIYEWKGKIEEDSEVLMMIKTQSSLVPALTDFVRSVHPYEVAEVIALPVEQGNFPYLHWVHQVTKSVSD